MVVSIVLDGKPKAKARARTTRRGSYDPQSEEAQTDRWRLKAKMNQPPLEGPLNVSLVFIFARPKSWPKNRKDTWHTSVPDVDNLIKYICDVGNATLWYDDRQIVTATATKLYGAEAKTIIVVNEI